METKSIKITNESDRISLVETVSEAASKQAKVTNRLWLAIIANTIFIFLPVTEVTASKEILVQLPFNLAKVPPTIFYPMAFAMLSVLAVALAAAHAQQMRADRIGHHVITDLTSNSTGNPVTINLNLRDLFDILRHPCITRVGPLAQLMTGHYHSQFESDDRARIGTQPHGWQFTTYYLVLKLFALVILFLLPGFGLVVAYRKVAASIDGILLCSLSILGIIALVVLLIVAICDSLSVMRLACGLRRKSN